MASVAESTFKMAATRLSLLDGGLEVGTEWQANKKGHINVEAKRDFRVVFICETVGIAKGGR